MMINKWILACMAAGSLIVCACSDDSDSKPIDDSDSKPITVVNTDQWIGNACKCEGSGCKALGIPLPAPQPGTQFAITGCDNMDASATPGSAFACLQTITGSMAPNAYFPAGYCALTAVGCDGGSFCSMAVIGDVEKMTSCPAGSTLLTSKFYFDGLSAMITNKTCAKNCNTDADCNAQGEIKCITKDDAKFCYNEKNFEFMPDGYTAVSF